MGIICSLSKRGYGFIRTPDGDVYVHSTAIKKPASFDTLHFGAQVEFSIGREGKVHADNVVVLPVGVSSAVSEPSTTNTAQQVNIGYDSEEEGNSRRPYPKQRETDEEYVGKDVDDHVAKMEDIENAEACPGQDDDETIGGRSQVAICSLSGRGYGFISTPSGDLYLHSTGMRERGTFDILRLGTRVEFVVKRNKTDGSLHADDVAIITVCEWRARHRAHREEVSHFSDNIDGDYDQSRPV